MTQIHCMQLKDSSIPLETDIGTGRRSASFMYQKQQNCIHISTVTFKSNLNKLWSFQLRKTPLFYVTSLMY